MAANKKTKISSKELSLEFLFFVARLAALPLPPLLRERRRNIIRVEPIFSAEGQTGKGCKQEQMARKRSQQFIDKQAPSVGQMKAAKNVSVNISETGNIENCEKSGNPAFSENALKFKRDMFEEEKEINAEKGKVKRHGMRHRACVQLQNIGHFIYTYGPFVFFVLFRLLNTARFGPGIAKEIQAGTAHGTAMGVYAGIWFQELSLYLFTAITLCSNFSNLVSRIRYYEQTFGYSRDISRFNFGMKVYVWLFIPFMISYVCWFVISMKVYFPDTLERQLYPMNETDTDSHIVYMLVIAAYILTFVLLYTGFHCTFSIMLILSLLLRREFLHVASALETTLNSQTYYKQDDSLPSKPARRRKQSKSNNQTDNWIQNKEKDNNFASTVQGCTITDAFDSENSCDNRADFVDDAKLYNEEALNKRKKTKQKIVEQKKGRVDKKCNFKEVLDAEKLVESDAVLHTPGQPTEQNYKTIEALDVEEAFDDLQQRYEALCSLVESVQDCYSHGIPNIYAFGILEFCFVVYTVASGSFPMSDLPPCVLILFSQFMVIFGATLIGCLVYDSAKAVLKPIYCANYAGLPTRLIQKMHLLATRVTTGEVGYHVYGLFVVNRQTVLMLSGTVLTYTLVVVQFQMGTDCSPCFCDLNTTAS